MSAQTLAQRCKLATDCLPQAEYRTRLEALHSELLAMATADDGRGPDVTAWVCEYESGEVFVSLAQYPFSDPNVRKAWRLLTMRQRDKQVAEAVAAERERLCAAIKAADDKSTEEAGYMLDSEDCISVIRGTWQAAPKARP
jgi:hypothetical protein